jgi:Flp pilus assembly protein TadD
VLVINPRFSPALNNLAYLYCERLLQVDRAYELADRARQLMPTDPVLGDTLGWILYRKGEFNRAFGLIQESANLLPGDSEIQFHLGMTQYMLGHEEPARAALEKSLQSTKDFPGQEEGRRRLAFLAMKINPGDPAAVADLEKRVQTDPRDPVAADRLAACYEQNGALGKAAETYQLLLKLNSKDAQVMGRLAALYAERLNDREKALSLAKTAHNLAPEDPAISLMLGRLVYLERDYKWALSLIQEAASKLPQEPQLQYDLAWACYSAGKVAEAEANMQTVVRAGASFAKLDDARQFLALLVAARNPAQAGEAAGQAQRIVQTNSGYVPAVMVCALIRQQQSKYDEAKQLYEGVLSNNALFTQAAREVAILCAAHFVNDPKAYDFALKAHEALPDDVELARALGILAFNRNDDARAVQLLAQCAQTQKEDGELLYYLGMAHYRLKHRPESKAALQHALALNVPAKFAADVNRILTELK